ncbi:MAG TPA: PAS domain S-box protein [Vicinamibacterales bacterium]|jgi:PAS domain S-box-containing protein
MTTADRATPSIVSRPPPTSRGAATSFAVAIVALAVAVLLRYLLDPWMGDTLPLVTLFGAVAAAVWIGGIRPAAVVAGLGYAVCDYLFIAPRGQFTNGGTAGLIGLIAYVFTCALIVGIGAAARREHRLAADRRELLRVTLLSIGDAVMTTDVAGRVTSMNAVAETLTGWSQADALGQPLEQVFHIVNEVTRQPVANPATKALHDGVVVGLANHTVLLDKDGGEHPIDDSAAPIRDEQGQVSGCVLIFRDVSTQRRVEQERTRQLMTARLLASIIESSDDAIISKSLDGVIQSWNESAERLFGHSAAQAVGRHISLIIPPDRLHEEDRIIASLKAGERIDHFETERVRADGGRILVSLTISPIRDDRGAVVGASKIVRDVTRQRHAEQRERLLLADAASANAKFQAFFEQSALFAGVIDVSGAVIDVNRQAWEGCGYSREQIVGKPFWEGPWWGGSTGVAKRLEEAAGRAARGAVFRGEIPYSRADGGERIADVMIQPITGADGGVLFLAWAGADITDRKRAEADREKFVTLVENSTDFIGMCDLAGVPFFVNRAGLEMAGLADLGEARRTPVQSFFFPEDQPRIMQEFLPQVLQRGHGEIEVRFRHFKTGEARWMAYKVVVLPDAAGHPVAFATVSQDVTERKRLADSLQTLAAELSEADRRKNEFLAMLAHELRNPLAPISNAARALRLGGGDNEAVRSASAMLERQVTQMSRLVDDLLDMSRITRGRIELRKSRVELATVVHQAVEAVRAHYNGLNHDLSVTLPPRPVQLDADPARLAQVIANLLNNACKFTDRGGQIRLTVTEERGEVVIRVRDSGIGIAAEHLSRVFDMFTQIDTSLERSRDGLGIGLTLVKTLVEMHGGSVEARSDGIGRGSEFTVRLPIVETLEAAPSPAGEPAVATGSRRILIVDDSEDGAESLAMLLEFGGHQTWQAHDGLDAITMAERLRPDVVLLDIGLPRMNGYEVCRRIRQEPWGRDLVLVALTGWGQDEDRRQSLDAGFNAHMVKPVDHDALLEFLASLPSPRDASSIRT